MKTVRHKRLLIAGATVAAVAAVAVPVATVLADSPAEPEAAECAIEALSDADGRVAKVSDSGEYMIGTLSVDGVNTPVLWRDGEATTLDADFYPTDVNSAGAVVGNRFDDESAAVLWHDGEYTELTVPDPQGGVQAVAINDAGVIAGNTGLESQEDFVYTDVPLRWAAGQTVAEELDVESGLLGTAYDIGADGTVVGRQTESHETGPWRAWSWNPAGDSAELLIPDPQEDVEAIAVRGEWALSRDYRWNLAEPDAPLENTMLTPLDIDEQGRVYGEQWDVDDVPSPAVETDGEVTLLPKLDEEYQEGDGDAVSSVNADGTILAGTSARGDSQLPVVWTCG